MIRKYKIIILFCILAVLCTFAVKYVVIRQQEHKIALLQKVISAARNGQYEVRQLKPANAPAVLAAGLEMNKILNKLPNEFTFTQYATTIRSFVDENNLSIDGSLTFKPEEIEDKNLLKFNTYFVVKGDYPTLKQFLSDIINLPGILLINSASFARAKSDLRLISLKIDLSVFFIRETA